MRERGIVTEVSGNLISVKISRKSACAGNCTECGGCGKNSEIVSAVNTANVKKGDIVELELDGTRVLKAAFFVYIIPLLIFAASYFISGIFIKNNIICVLTAFIFLLISFFLLHYYDKKNGEKYMPQAVLRISNDDESSVVEDN